jgi:type VI secretion system protein ImpM
MSTALFPAVCFGKLPSFGDFIRHNAASREVLAFDEWIHQGLYYSRAHFGASWDQAFAAAPQYHFLFYPENADRFLVGLMQPSRDKSLRSYPFVVSLLIDRRRIAEGRSHLLPITLSQFLVGSRQLVSRALNGMDAREIADQTQSLSFAALDQVASESVYRTEFLEKVGLERFWQNLFGSFNDPRKYLILNNLGETLQPFKSRGLHRLTLGLRFPLSSDPSSATYEVCFWVQLCLTILGAPAVTPILFWAGHQDTHPGYLFLFFRQPSPRNYLQLLQPDIDSETICAVDKDGRDKLTTLSSSPSNNYRTLLDSGGQSLSQFLLEIRKAADLGYFR